MCDQCGCSGVSPSDYAHPHDHPPHGKDTPPGRIVRLEQDLLAHNQKIAEANRAWLGQRAIFALNLISSPGSGKTLLLERTLERLKDRIGLAVIVGDLQTDRDAARLRVHGVPVHQIETVNACHLDASMVQAALPEVVRPETRLLLIENVGNLVCPAAFDLGENARAVLLSVTEGEDKPLKYPVPFRKCQTVVVTKTDLAPHVDWDRDQCLAHVRRVNPWARLFEVSARSGLGLEAWIEALVDAAASVAPPHGG
ncbi:MAG: hydrogenase nickel incorporation protein HypB [Alphaproteobacteria bacterium]